MTENEKITKDILNLFPCALGDECQGIDYCKHCQQDKKLVLDALDTKDLKNKSLEDELSTLRKEKEVARELLAIAHPWIERCPDDGLTAQKKDLITKIDSILRKDWL